MKSLVSVMAAALLALGLAGVGGSAHAAGEPAPFEARPSDGVFLQLTDIHFTPFSDAKTLAQLVASPIEDWPTILSAAPAVIAGAPDTDYPLLIGALNNARLRAHYDFVINTGDYLGHNFKKTYDALGGDDGPDNTTYDQFVSKTLSFVYQTLARSFPDTSVITTLGNNDDACGDYRGDHPDPTTRAFGALLAPLGLSAPALRDAVRLGSYVAPMPHAAGRDIIALDDVSWSSGFKTCGGGDGAAEAQDTLQWLAQTLAAERAAGRTALLIMHIPPGIDAFGSAQAACPNPGQPFWSRPALDGFVALASKYRDVVKVAITGHTHMDEFRVVTDQGEPVTAVRISPAVTPLFGNNPSYTVFQYDRRGGAIKNYATYSVSSRAQAGDAAAWTRLYAFDSTYGYRDFTPRTVFELVNKTLTEDGQARKSYGDNFAAGGASAITSNTWTTFSCAQLVLADPQYTACRCP